MRTLFKQHVMHEAYEGRNYWGEGVLNRWTFANTFLTCKEMWRQWPVPKCPFFKAFGWNYRGLQPPPPPPHTHTHTHFFTPVAWPSIPQCAGRVDYIYNVL